MTSWVLAFDTATEAVAVAVGRRENDSIELVAAYDGIAPRAAMTTLLPVVETVLAQAGRGLSGIDEVVVGRGPGSFTGVRIGVSTAKGIARGLGVPLLGVGTLDAVAWAFPPSEGALLGVVGDAMRGEVYPALFRMSGGGPIRQAPDRVSSPEGAAADWAELGESITLVGNGLAKHAVAFADALGSNTSIADERYWAPSGTGLLAAYVAARAAGAAASGDPGRLLPIYTRLSDAEEAERRRAGLPAVPLPDDGVHGPGGPQ